jgi:dihydroorotase
VGGLYDVWMTQPSSIIIESPFDMHLHLREGAMLNLVAPLSAKSFAGAIIMPNLVPPVDSLERLLKYRDDILKATDGLHFMPLMTVFFKKYDRKELEQLQPHIIGIKLYPQGATTNSDKGIADLAEATQTLFYMEELGIPLFIHGESTSAFVMDREASFLPVYRKIAKDHPRLKIVMEHITTAAAVKLLDEIENCYATVTLHHLEITLDDVVGGMLKPHLFCKPIAKRPEDRDALLQAALMAHPKLCFGSDSAPHPLHKKECCGCAAGVFTAPIALACLAELFEKHGALQQLQNFVSNNARSIYGISELSKKVHLEKAVSIIPDCYGDVVPYRAGETLSWSISKIDSLSE